MSETPLERPRPLLRPRLWWLTAALAVFQVGAALRSLQVPPALAAQVGLPLALEFVAGVLWALLFVLATVALLRRNTAARWRSMFLIAVFIIYSAARLAVFARADYDRQRLPMLLLIAGGCVLGLSAIALRLRRAGVRSTEIVNGRERESQRQD